MVCRGARGLDQIVQDFSNDGDLRERVMVAQASVVQLEAVRTKADIERARTVGQPRRAASLIKSVPGDDVAAEVQAQVRELQRVDAEAQAAADRQLAVDLQAAVEPPLRGPEEGMECALLEILAALAVSRRGPRSVRCLAEGPRGGGKAPEAEAALAFSGYVAGSDAAVDDLAVAETLLDDARPGSLLPRRRRGVGANLEPRRPSVADAPRGSGDARSDPVVRRDHAAHPAHATSPSRRRNQERSAPAGPRICRIRDDENNRPTEYMVALPPEYHLRSYPAIVALHDGSGPNQTLAWWSAEAARRGYIVVAAVSTSRPGGRISVLGQRACRGRAGGSATRDGAYAIDSDRVFLGGQLAGANMAWDFGLAHPDLFAGVIVVSGLPFKYVNRYLANAEKPSLPLYVVLGDLAPAGSEVVFGQMLKPLISRAWDVTYVEYFKRGLEALPEEAAPALDWADRRRREAIPKSFEAITARPTDNRFFGIVVREAATGRTTAPAAVDPFGKNLNPASIKMKSSTLSNLLNIQAAGVKRLDVWLSPKLIDMAKKLEVRINGRLSTGDRPSRPADLPRGRSARGRPAADLLDEGRRGLRRCGNAGCSTGAPAANVWGHARRDATGSGPSVPTPNVRTESRSGSAALRDRATDPGLGPRRRLLPDFPRSLRP
ncbi:MAG: hypothetical protein U0794_07650 [Isosphaeraceae bacterium]